MIKTNYVIAFGMTCAVLMLVMFFIGSTHSFAMVLGLVFALASVATAAGLHIVDLCKPSARAVAKRLPREAMRDTVLPHVIGLGLDPWSVVAQYYLQRIDDPDFFKNEEIIKLFWAIYDNTQVGLITELKDNRVHVRSLYRRHIYLDANMKMRYYQR